MIGILLKPFEDELISSWFTRLSIQNGIDDVRCFIQSYVSPHKMLKSISNTSSCTNLYLLYFCKVSGMSPYELFVNQTEYPAVAPFLTDYRQTQILLNAFGNPIGGTINRFIKETHICEECQKEEPYIRISHNLPGVRACWKHKCSLDGAPVEQNDIDFAQYAHEFLCAKIDCNVKQLIRVAAQYGVTLTPHIGFAKGIAQLMKNVSVQEIKNHFIGTSEKVKPVSGYEILHTGGTISEFRHQCGTQFCMNANGFNLGFQCPKCQAEMKAEERFENYVDHVGGYKLISPYRGLGKKVQLLHTCGKVIEMRAFSFLEGTRCICNYYHTPNEIQKTINKFGNFQLIKYENETATLFHKDCGRTFTIGYKKFLTRPWCKKCKPQFIRTEESVRAEVQSINKEFEYVTGYRASTASFIIRHNCGFEFSRNIYEFRRNPTCPMCKRRSTGIRRTAFVKYMENKSNRTVTIKEMQLFANVNYGNAKCVLQGLVKVGLAEKSGRGKYKLKET